MKAAAQPSRTDRQHTPSRAGPAVGPGNRAVAGLLVQRAPDPKALAAASAQAQQFTQNAAALDALRRLAQSPSSWLSVLAERALRSGLPLGFDAGGNPIVVHVIPGKTTEVAMVVAGVHGSEVSGVEVADRLLVQLQAFQPHFTVVVVPQLFPSNIATKDAWEQKLAKDHQGILVGQYQKLRDEAGDPARGSPGQTDPNREFPDLGKDLDLTRPVDAKGRIIEPSNLALMALIEQFKPSRIVSLHAIKILGQAGVFADPHPSVKGHETDPQARDADALALAMARRGKALGANVSGNQRGRAGWSSLYPGQDPTMSPEQIARENAKGRSLGQWAPSKGITVITMEMGEQYRSGSAVKDPGRAAELEASATVIREIFLGPPATAPAPPGAVPVQPSRDLPAEDLPVQRLLLRSLSGAGNRALGRLLPP